MALEAKTVADECRDVAPPLFRAGISVTAGLLLAPLLETPPVFGSGESPQQSPVGYISLVGPAIKAGVSGQI